MHANFPTLISLSSVIQSSEKNVANQRFLVDSGDGAIFVLGIYHRRCGWICIDPILGFIVPDHWL